MISGPLLSRPWLALAACRRNRVLFGHTLVDADVCLSSTRLARAHPSDDAGVCLSSTRCATLVSVNYFDWQRREDRDVRPSTNDLETIQKRALAEGLPYQTFIASLLHKYATGRLERI